MKVLINPDIHGRHFWETCIKEANDSDKIIFLGDYMDPYDFEHISIQSALENFETILAFAAAHKDKVVLLLGNHDMPYFSDTYFNFSWYHSRHSKQYHNDIKQRFNEYKDLFKIAYGYEDILFTHAGCTKGWLKNVFTDLSESVSLNELVGTLNNLLNTDKGLSDLYMISGYRGGYNLHGSCIWADIREFMGAEAQNNKGFPFKQVFGHTLQAYYDADGSVKYGKPIENPDYKMLDVCKTFELNCQKFIISPIE